MASFVIIPTLSTAIHSQFTVKLGFGLPNLRKPFTVKRFDEY